MEMRVARQGGVFPPSVPARPPMEATTTPERLAVEVQR